MLEETRNLLKSHFRDIHDQLQIHVPDEKSRRVGQAVAAASLPRLRTPVSV